MAEREKTSRIVLTEEEANIEVPLRGLVDKVVKEFDKGAEVVDLQFPGSRTLANMGAFSWFNIWPITAPDGGKVNIKPISVVYQALQERGYIFECKAGSQLPDGAIRFSREAVPQYVSVEE